MSAPVPPPKAEGVSNCASLKRLKISARKSSPMFSQGSAKRLITEKSVFTKFGPEIGARLAVPSSPSGAVAKAQGLKLYPEDFPSELGAKPPLETNTWHMGLGLAATIQGTNGLATLLARPAGDAVPILINDAPD